MKYGPNTRRIRIRSSTPHGSLAPVKQRIDELGRVIRFIREKGTDDQQNMIPTIYQVQDKVIWDASRKLDVVRP